MPNYTLRRLVVAFIALALVAGVVFATSSSVEVDCLPGEYTIEQGDTLWGVFHQVCDGDVVDLVDEAHSRLGEGGLRPGMTIVIAHLGDEDRQVIGIKVPLSRVYRDAAGEWRGAGLYSANEQGIRSVEAQGDIVTLVTFIKIHSD